MVEFQVSGFRFHVTGFRSFEYRLAGRGARTKMKNNHRFRRLHRLERISKLDDPFAVIASRHGRRRSNPVLGRTNSEIASSPKSGSSQ